jgi:hypothetical protein
VKGAVLTVVLTITIMSVAVGVAAWSPWSSEVREHENAWMLRYAGWYASVGRDLSRGKTVGSGSCRSRFDRRVGPAPSTTLTALAHTAQRACSGLDSSTTRAEWDIAGDDVIDSLVSSHSRRAHVIKSRRFSALARSLSGRRARVFCWTERDWTPLAEEWNLFRGDEFWVAGIATPAEHRIDLAPSVCDPLEKFYGERYAPHGSSDSLYLAEALVTLAHEAEHLRQPLASEAIVECYALQRVRGLVRSEGWSPMYQEEMAGLAFSVSYPNLPDEYRIRACRSGGPYDIHPHSKTWP